MGNTTGIVQSSINVEHFHRGAEREGADSFFFDVFVTDFLSLHLIAPYDISATWLSYHLSYPDLPLILSFHI